MKSAATRGIDRRVVLSTLAMLPVLAGALPRTFAQAQSTDPLPSWNDGAAKEAILQFVRATTDPSSPSFVSPQARIATFDQDGTLWVEHPMYTQVTYCLERVPAVVAQRPELAKRRAIQDRSVRQPRGHGTAADEGAGGGPRGHSHRHDGG